MAPAPRNQAAQALEEFQKALPERKLSQLPTPKLQLPTWESLGGYGFLGHGIWKLGVGS